MGEITMSETAIRLPISEPNTIDEQFARLVAVWKEETLPLSSSVQMTAHPAYQAIIALGPPVIPLLLRELEQNPDHWFAALRTLTGANPVQPEQQGRVNEMADAWLQWAKA
jgi:hypothetical protein